MKKIIFLLAIVSLIFFTSALDVKALTGERMVQEILGGTNSENFTPNPPQLTEKELAAIKATPGKFDKLNEKLFGNKKDPKGEIEKLRDMASSAATNAADAASKAQSAANEASSLRSDLVGIMKDNVKATVSNTTAVKNLWSYAVWGFDGVIEQGKANTWLICILLALAVAIIVAVMLFTNRRNRRQEETRWQPIAQDLATANSNSAKILTAVETLSTTVSSGFASMKEDIPAETVRQINELNPAPFEFDVVGHHVSYTSPMDGIAEGYYKTFQITEMPDGENHPETFERQAETKRGIALNYIRGMMKKFLEGKLKGTPEAALIMYLKGNGDIRIRKIN
jgi:predicted outer membrane lipoprotein